MAAPKYQAGGGIYAIVHVASGRMYVGQTARFRGRFNHHRTQANAGKHCNQHLQSAWTKYGEASFTFEVLEVVHDPEQLTAREQHWIDSTKAVERGFNMCPAAGSCAGRKMSASHREKIRAAHKALGLTPAKKAHLDKVHDSMRGRKLSPEHVAKVLAARVGYTHSEETRAKLSAAHMGRTKSTEAVAKQRASLTGRKQPQDEIERRRASMMGHPVSAEARANMSAAQKGHAVTDAQRMAISAKLSGRKQSPEQIAKRKASIAARSPEQEADRRRKLAASTAAYWARRRAELASNVGGE